MKKSLIILALLSLTVISYAQRKHHNKRHHKVKSTYAKHHDNIDDRMKGPGGAAIYIGPNGGRYYIKNGKRVYVQYKGNNK